MPQSLSSILIHLVFSTKNREPFITDAIESELHRYLGGIFRDCKYPSLLIGGDRDHIHILFALSRTRTVADLVEEVKSSSSKWIKTKGERVSAVQMAGRLWRVFHRAIKRSGLETVHQSSEGASSRLRISG